MQEPTYQMVLEALRDLVAGVLQVSGETPIQGLDHARAMLAQADNATNQGDWYVPVNNGKIPDDCVVVHKVTPGEVQVYQQGGGFAWSTGHRQFDRLYRPVYQSDIDEAPWRESIFRLGDGQQYAGWTQGFLWQGYAVPFFIPLVARKIIEDNKPPDFNGKTLHASHYNAMTNEQTLIAYPGTPFENTWSGITITTKEGPQLVYGVGEKAWPWNE